MKKRYDGLDAYKIQLNRINTTSTSVCHAIVELIYDSDGVCRECDQTEQLVEGATKEV